MEGTTKRKQRGRPVALLAIGLALGVTIMATPASGHVTGNLGHLVKHLKKSFYTKAQSDNRFVNVGETAAQADNAANADTLDGVDSTAFAPAGHNHDSAYAAMNHHHDSRYFTETESDARYAQLGHNHDGSYYTKAMSDSRYLATGAKATDADKLDGVDSSGFVQGKGTVYRGRLTTGISGGAVVLEVPGVATVRVLNCRTGAATPDANAQIDNFANSQPVDIWRQTESGDPNFSSPSGGWASSTPLKQVTHTTFEVASGSGSAARATTIDVWTHANSARCLFVATATVRG